MCDLPCAKGHHAAPVVRMLRMLGLVGEAGWVEGIVALGVVVEPAIS